MLNSENIFDVAITGGGILGLSIGYILQSRYPNVRIVIFEKESQLAQHQTGKNSGVIHSGIYYQPGSKKAQNCVEGRKALVAFAQQYKLPMDICGKVIVATEAQELPHLDRILDRGLQNQVEGIEKVGPTELRDLEPHCAGLAAIHVPCAGIIDYRAVVQQFADLILGIQPKSKIATHHQVRHIQHGATRSEIFTSQGSYSANMSIFCGGLYSDKLAQLDGLTRPARIVGFRGDYYELTEAAQYKVKNLIYPVPNPAFPFLGVHFTRMIHGGVECGPNAVFSFKREGYDKTAFNWADSWDALSYTGTWTLFARHWKFGLNEYRRAFSKERFYRQVKRLIPSLEKSEIVPARAGVRAMALKPDGEMVDDFLIKQNRHAIHILNAPSPAATACLAIAQEVEKVVKARFSL